VIRFKPFGETRVDDVVATLEDLYAETAKPVSARQIGDVVGMQPHQTLAYLHEANGEKFIGMLGNEYRW